MQKSFRFLNLGHLERHARKIEKKEELPWLKALEKAAKEGGFESYFDARQRLSEKNVVVPKAPEGARFRVDVRGFVGLLPGQTLGEGVRQFYPEERGELSSLCMSLLAFSPFEISDISLDKARIVLGSMKTAGVEISIKERSGEDFPPMKKEEFLLLVSGFGKGLSSENARAVMVPSANLTETSSDIFCHYARWTAHIEAARGLYEWTFGEDLSPGQKTSAFVTRNCFEFFSLGFFGASGAGKTEAMKFTVTDFLCRLPESRLLVLDPKGLGEWDVFGPYTEPGRVIKDRRECVLSIAALDELFERRKKFMAEKSYRNLSSMTEEEKKIHPPVLVVIEEFAMLEDDLRFSINSKVDKTPANTIFKIYTLGRSFGIWVILGSQMADSAAIPTEIQANLQARMIMKMTKPSSSAQWLESECAYRLGNEGAHFPDGTTDRQWGHGFLNSERDRVRSLLMGDFFIERELRKYGVPRIEGAGDMSPKSSREPRLPLDLRDLLALKGEEGLSFFQKERLAAFRMLVKTISEGGESRRPEERPRLLLRWDEKAVSDLNSEKDTKDARRKFQALLDGIYWA